MEYFSSEKLEGVMSFSALIELGGATFMGSQDDTIYIYVFGDEYEDPVKLSPEKPKRDNLVWVRN